MLISRLNALGFDPVIVLDAEECGQDGGSIVLAFCRYAAEECPQDAAWIHPYYFVSQHCYTVAKMLAEELADEGVSLRDDIALKPIFARIPEITQGRNTLSVLKGQGSRFHVQTFVSGYRLGATHHLLKERKQPHCGACRKCMDACPTGAIEEDRFCKEKCIRYWQLSGKIVPEELRRHIKGSLLGCDICQVVCPQNAPVDRQGEVHILLKELLLDAKAACEKLKEWIGANLSIPNRVLSHACLLAGNSSDAEYLPMLKRLSEHSSAAVREHARWAIRQLENQT